MYKKKPFVYQQISATELRRCDKACEETGLWRLGVGVKDSTGRNAKPPRAQSAASRLLFPFLTFMTALMKDCCQLASGALVLSVIALMETENSDLLITDHLPPAR